MLMHHRKTYMYSTFQQNRVSRSVKTTHTNLFAKICNLQLEFKKNSAMQCPLTDIQADVEINWPVRYRNTAKINYFHRRQTSRTT